MQTRELATFIARSRLHAIPETVQDEGARAIVNWIGCALGGAMDPALDTALDALFASSGPQQATLIGRGDRTDILFAALASGIGSSALDFDDTHCETLIHPSVPVAAALFPLAEHRAAAGTELLHAFLIGVEVACRAGLALGRGHRERGWHHAATTGVLGAAAGCAKLLALDVQGVQAALGIAATQAGGIAEMTESSTNSLDMGFAARNGLSAALLAEREFSAAEQALEGRRGFVSVLGADGNADAFIAGLGSTWHATRLAYKPFACSTVLHPAIDACLQLRREHRLRPGNIAAVRLRVNPLAMQSSAGRDPANGRAARSSIHHCVAVALADGAAGVQQFQDDRVQHPRVAQLRARIEAIPDASLAPIEARAQIALRDGRSAEHHVRCALGSPERPMTDAQLSDKFRMLAAEVLATDQSERLLALAWNLRALIDVGALVRASVPDEEIEPAELPGSPLIPR